MMTFFTHAKAALKRFAQDTRGTVAVETVIVLPVLFWTLTASYVYFDANHQHSINVKANYTMGDVLSRETEAITDSYVDGMQSLFTFMVEPDSTPRMRITVAMWDEEDNKFKLDWSEARSTASAHSQTTLNAMSDSLPTMMDNERIIIVETWTTHTPIFDVGLSQQTIYNISFTSPRFAPQLVFDS